ncbi:Galactose oxidase/kelch repeat superfamily protein [Hibiscus syriacus]|uniref:Galactose oxidase/kelch repeat superfamily protein n=1 Tax=Hibiscus syriacus TaxID=106335 RepID=A0A6A2YDI5_HIBSY|nr:Galactose oxidase/kelch repeat superfamily protein [Hibiscus syriacus]
MADKRVEFLIKGEVCEESVFRWYNDACTGKPGKRSELSSKAKKHLSAMGWNFWHAPKNGRHELRYQSLEGKVYYTLKAACKGYIDTISVAGKEKKGVADGNLQPKQPLKRNSNHGPAANIFLDDGSGRSLSYCQRQVRDSMESSKVSRKFQMATGFTLPAVVAFVPILLGNNLNWTLLKTDACSNRYTDHGYGLDSSGEIHSKLNVALDVMHECFEPSSDVYTGREIVQDVIFSKGSKLKRLNFNGFYIVIMEENDEMVSVATVRVYGETVAEMPLVATRFSHRHRSMCRVLIDELEKNLEKLGVQRLVLPAVAGVMDMWITNFGFSRMTGEERSKYLQYTFLDFQGTIMCQKTIENRVVKD